MRRFFMPAALAAALVAGAADARAQDRAPPDRAPKANERLPAPAAKPPERPNTIESLFERLSGAKDEDEARGIATLIERRWSRSGSDTADLLMSRAGEAFRDKEYGLSIELLDRILALKPDWAEAWHRRATAFYLLDDPVRAMSDLQQAIAREPRHFGAWAGLGHVLMAGENKRGALEAYRRALAIHPHMEKLKEFVERLKPDVDGIDL
jgi:tetratricopeptide (TPR) repeat protein